MSRQEVRVFLCLQTPLVLTDPVREHAPHFSDEATQTQRGWETPRGHTAVVKAAWP